MRNSIHDNWLSAHVVDHERCRIVLHTVWPHAMALNAGGLELQPPLTPASGRAQEISGVSSTPPGGHSIVHGGASCRHEHVYSAGHMCLLARAAWGFAARNAPGAAEIRATTLKLQG